MPPERKLAGFARCVACSPQHTYKGANVYGHKTAGAVELMHPRTYANYRRVSSRKAKGTNGAAFRHGTTTTWHDVSFNRLP